MKRFLLSLLLLIPALALGQTDNYISSGSVSPYLTLGRGLAWGGSGLGTIGQNFIFAPLDPNQGFCVFIFNNNPSSTHTVSLTVAQTGDPSVKTYGNNTARWTNVATNTSFPVSINPNTLIGINYKTTASAGVTISFTGNTALGGSPDTADVFTVQTNQSSCGTLPTNAVQGPFQNTTVLTPSQKFPVLIGGLNAATGGVNMYSLGTTGGNMLDAGSNNPPLGANGIVFKSSMWGPNCINSSNSGVNCTLPAIQLAPWGGVTTGKFTNFVYTNMLEMANNQTNFASNASSAMYVQASVVNPGAASATLHHFMAAGTAFDMQYKTATLSCSAACEIKILRTTTAGTTCGALTVRSMQIGAGTRGTVTAGDNAENACTGLPTTSETMYDIFLGANVPQVIDFSGWMNPHSSAISGVLFENITAVTGTESVTLQLVELPD